MYSFFDIIFCNNVTLLQFISHEYVKEFYLNFVKKRTKNLSKIGNNKCLKTEGGNAYFGKILKSKYIRKFSALNLNAKNYWIY